MTLIKGVKKKALLFFQKSFGQNLRYPSLLSFYDNKIIVKNFFRTELFKIKEVRGGGATWGEPGPDRGGYYRQSSGVGSWSQRKGDPTEGFKMEAHMISFGP